MVRIERLIIVLLGIALLQAWWKLYRGKVKRWWTRTKDWIPRHWQPKSPADCPRCQGGEEIEEVVLPVETLPYAERKSQRGRKKQLDTHGWACPNEGCALFGETDAKRHALVGHGKIGCDKNIQRLKCQVCETTFSCRKGTPLYYTKADPAEIAEALWWLAEGVDISVLERKTGYQEATLRKWLDRAGEHCARWHALLALHHMPVLRSYNPINSSSWDELPASAYFCDCFA